MLKTLMLHNFRSHKDTKIKFTHGLNVIIGENGAGKSSIFQAIGIGLFNSIHNMKELIRYGQLSAMVDIVFSFNDSDYRSVREFGKAVSWKLFEAESPIADGQEAVCKKLSEIFGLTEVLDLPTFFNEMVGVGQFNMVSPFTQSLAPRKAYFNRLLGTDEYDLTYQNLRNGEKFGEDLLKADEIKLAELRVELKHYLEGLAEKENLQITLLAHRDDLAELLVQKQFYQEQIEAQQIQKKSYLEVKELQEKLNYQKQQLEKQREYQTTLIAIAAEQLVECQKAAMLLPQLEKEQELYEIQLAQYEQQNEHNTELYTRKKILEKQLHDLQFYDTCPICGSDIKEHRSTLLEGTQIQLDGIVFHENYKPQPPARYEIVKESASNFVYYNEKYQNSLKELEPIDLQEQSVEVQLALLKLPEFNEQEFDELNLIYIKHQTHIATTEVKIESIMRRMDEISKLKPDVETIERLISEKKKSLETLKDIRSVYKQLGPIMAQRLLEQINEEAKILFSNLLGEHYQVDVEISGDYEIVADIEGNKVSFGNLSGGQQVLLALAIRLALLKVLSGMEFMLIDEPFDSLDQLSQEAVIKALSELSLGQLIVITHNDAFDADNVIKFELVEGVSKWL